MSKNKWTTPTMLVFPEILRSLNLIDRISPLLFLKVRYGKVSDLSRNYAFRHASGKI
jgi:hypothetical protein